MLNVKCITDFKELKMISANIERLLHQSSNNSYSLSWSWLSTWIDTYLENHQLLCLAVYEKNELVGLGPFWIEQVKQLLFNRVRILRFLGSREVCPDHLDLIVNKSNSEAICMAIWEYLFGPTKKKWDIWDYSNVSVDSNLLKYLYTFSDQDSRCLGFKINGMMASPYIDLPETWESYLASLNSKKRRALKISTNLLAEAGTVTLKFCKTNEELPYFLNTHITLHRKSWHERGKTGSFGTDKFKQFHSKYMQAQLLTGNLFLCNLEINNIPVGSFYGFTHNRTLYYYLIGTNRTAVPRASVGKVLLALCIQEAIKQGYKKFDFLRGIEPYKYDWTEYEQRELLVTIYNRSFCALVYIFKQFIGSYGRQICNAILKENTKYLKLLLGKKAENTTKGSAPDSELQSE